MSSEYIYNFVLYSTFFFLIACIWNLIILQYIQWAAWLLKHTNTMNRGESPTYNTDHFIEMVIFFNIRQIRRYYLKYRKKKYGIMRVVN